MFATREHLSDLNGQAHLPMIFPGTSHGGEQRASGHVAVVCSSRPLTLQLLGCFARATRDLGGMGEGA